MASPLKTGKQSVSLDAKGPRVSRIRRDPPPVLKEIPVKDRDEVDRWAVGVGVIVFALAIMVVLIGFSSMIGWSPSDYRVRLG